LAQRVAQRLAQKSRHLTDGGNMRQDLLSAAEQICTTLGVRFTSPRRRVLELLSQSPTPLKAYDLIAAAGPDGGAVKPPTVYRALEFLCAAGLVHRIEQDSTFVACQHGHVPSQTQGLDDHHDHDHLAGLFVCKQCGRASEVHIDQIGAELKRAAANMGFAMERVIVEGRGVCQACAA
jgi:Fur family transcriptional regulator, zinc uptake regulator